LELEKINTPGQKTIQDIADNYGIAKENQIKTLMYMADNELIAVIVRGDRELNETKLKNAIACNNLFMADEETVKQVCGAGFGSLGPVGLPVKVYADLEVSFMKNFACGANEDNYHFINVNVNRDFLPEAYIDVRNAVEGDQCPVCGSSLISLRGIEVGHIFKLMTKYSKAMNATYLDHNGKEQLMVMGCYGIGVSRTMAAAIEQNHDADGIIWPVAIAPYEVIVVPVNIKNHDQMKVAAAIYSDLQARGIEVIIDDRDERAGVKFKDADLIGIPVRITIGAKSLQNNEVEIKKRWEKEPELIKLDAVLDIVNNIFGKLEQA
jgi:prolyl-tRNA synthetase